MLGSCKDATERLYLQKDASGDISVSCSDLTQNQIDGVRFLFTQYKKEKLGVILNYPNGCGNSVQVAIFISAIYETLKRPVLILYDGDQEKKAWLARFATWTAISEDLIEIEATNAYLRKQIFLKNVADIGKFYRRHWGIVVVKSDVFTNVFRKCLLKVDFKIWITAQDLKKNRDLLHSVCTWINPSDQLLQEYLNSNSPHLFREDTTAEMLLDLLLEDILFTRRGLKPFGTVKRKHEPEVPVLRVTKKNKDATGKKIKRSKKREEVAPTSTICIESITPLHDQDNTFQSIRISPKNSNGGNFENNFTINVNRTDENEESKMDVESFIRDNDPLQSDINLSFAIRSLDNTSQPCESSSPPVEEVFSESSLSFANTVADIVRIDKDLPAEIFEGSLSSNPEVEKNNVGNLTPGTTGADVEVKESTGITQIDLSKPGIQKVFFVSAQEKGSFEPGLVGQKDTGEIKTEKESSDRERSRLADQESRLEVSTSVVKETESSFDTKMKELEEQTLRKFKGSFLDNIF